MITPDGYVAQVWRRTTESVWSWRRAEHTPWPREVRDWIQSDFYLTLINKHVSLPDPGYPVYHSHG